MVALLKVVLRLTFQIKLEFENAGFEERARTEYPKKNLFKARQRPTT